MKFNYASLTVGELVAKDYRTADVFKKHGIDFCCGGKKSLDKVCEEKGIDRYELEKELSAVEATNVLPSQDFSEWELDFLAEHIVQTHHRYVKASIPLLRQYLDKVATAHGHHYTEMVKIAELFDELAVELTHHMRKEENILFPYVKELATAKRNNSMPMPAMFGTVENPVRMMEHEHDVAGNLVKEIQKLSGNFTPPADACNTFRVSYGKLNEFAQDLFLHIHLENNILFPKAIRMEKQFAAVQAN